MIYIKCARLHHMVQMCHLSLCHSILLYLSNDENRSKRHISQYVFLSVNNLGLFDFMVGVHIIFAVHFWTLIWLFWLIYFWGAIESMMIHILPFPWIWATHRSELVFSALSCLVQICSILASLLGKLCNSKSKTHFLQ